VRRATSLRRVLWPGIVGTSQYREYDVPGTWPCVRSFSMHFAPSLSNTSQAEQILDLSKHTSIIEWPVSATVTARNTEYMRLTDVNR